VPACFLLPSALTPHHCLFRADAGIESIQNARCMNETITRWIFTQYQLLNFWMKQFTGKKFINPGIYGIKITVQLKSVWLTPLDENFFYTQSSDQDNKHAREEKGKAEIIVDTSAIRHSKTRRLEGTESSLIHTMVCIPRLMVISSLKNCLACTKSYASGKKSLFEVYNMHAQLVKGSFAFWNSREMTRLVFLILIAVLLDDEFQKLSGKDTLHKHCLLDLGRP